MSDDEGALQKPVHQSSPSLLEKLGAGTDALLEDFFYWWGTGELQGVSEFSPQWSVSFQNVHAYYPEIYGTWKSVGLDNVKHY
jgi:hypothetical protein